MYTLTPTVGGPSSCFYPAPEDTEGIKYAEPVDRTAHCLFKEADMRGRRLSMNGRATVREALQVTTLAVAGECRTAVVLCLQ